MAPRFGIFGGNRNVDCQMTALGSTPPRRPAACWGESGRSVFDPAGRPMTLLAMAVGAGATCVEARHQEPSCLYIVSAVAGGCGRGNAPGSANLYHVN